MEEIWKDIKDYEGYYQVSNTGFVRSVDRVVINNKGFNRTCKGVVLVGRVGGNGYIEVTLAKRNKKPTKCIHRLVAIYFLKQEEGKICVNHINAIKTDNRVENLEWCTYKENSAHGYRLGIMNTPKGNQKPNAILNEHKVREIRVLLKEGYSQSSISKKYAISPCVISFINSNKYWKWVV